jgi:preprotein translocase subunit SecB
MVGESGAGVDSDVPAKEFSLRRIELRKAAFDAPKVPYATAVTIAVEDMSITVARQIEALGGDAYILSLIVDVLAVVQGVTIFKATVEEVGVFRVSGYPEEEVRTLLGTKGAEQIYPYARELILSMVSRCGYQNLSLRPFSFVLPKVENPDG